MIQMGVDTLDCTMNTQPLSFRMYSFVEIEDVMSSFSLANAKLLALANAKVLSGSYICGWSDVAPHYPSGLLWLARCFQLTLMPPTSRLPLVAFPVIHCRRNTFAVTRVKLSLTTST